MADKPTGVAKALNLTESVRALGVEKLAADPEGDQLGLFEGSSVFGTIVVDQKRIVPNGPGRPKGSVNKSTAELVKLIQSKGRHPLLAMAEIVATPIDVIAATLNCSKLDAADYHRKVMSDLAPYVAQRQPVAVQVEGANAGMLVLNIGAVAASGNAGGFGLDMTLAAESAKVVEHIEENQGVGGGSGASSNNEPSNE